MKCDICNHECWDTGTGNCGCCEIDKFADRVLSELFFDYVNAEVVPTGRDVKWLIGEVMKRLKGRANPQIVSKHCEWYWGNWGRNGV